MGNRRARRPPWRGAKSPQHSIATLRLARITWCPADDAATTIMLGSQPAGCGAFELMRTPWPACITLVPISWRPADDSAATTIDSPHVGGSRSSLAKSGPIQRELVLFGTSSPSLVLFGTLVPIAWRPADDGAATTIDSPHTEGVVCPMLMLSCPMNQQVAGIA